MSDAISSPLIVHSSRLTLILSSILLLPACRQGEKVPPSSSRGNEGGKKADAKPSSEQKDDSSEAAARAKAKERTHTVVFSDRTSHSYLLLLPDREKPDAPSRETLKKWVEKTRAEGDPRDRLIELIATRPHATPRGRPGSEEGHADGGNAERSDLLGLHIELLPIGLGEEALVPPQAFEDPVLLRELDEAQRKSLPTRRWALLLRADYRHQHELRGLRLLQTLIEVVVSQNHALIHDPDTWEILDLEAFSRRRLKPDFRNVGEQIAIVPSLDTTGNEKRVRLSTRGMRRFASVDLELHDLPPDPALLERASLFLRGLAYQMAQLGELDPRGYAIELDEEITLSIDDVRATLPDPDLLPPCSDCPGQAALHLVERAAEKGDPVDHVVARVVAPREESDRAEYDHAAWALKAIGSVLGAPGPARPTSTP